LLQELIYGWPMDGHSGLGYNYAYAVGSWKEQPVSLPDETRAKLADHCRKVVDEGPAAEQPFAASVLVSTAIGWSTLTDAEQKKLFLSSHPSTWRWAALALGKNGRRKELIAWAGERPPADRLDVVWILQHELPKEWEWSDDELKFFLGVARQKPGSIAYVLRSWGGPTPAALREPIRAYLKREIAELAVKDSETQPAFDLAAALQVLASWKDPDDTSLLLNYLKHPASNVGTRNSGGPWQKVRFYDIRSRVRFFLKQRGVEIPPGVVYEKELGPVKDSNASQPPAL
jgi:hypothetical protein